MSGGRVARADMDPEISVVPLTPDRTADFERLFGPSGACYGCWCTYFRLSPRLRQSLDTPGRHDIMVARIKAGPPPGLLAYAAEGPVGWMQVGPRTDVPQWNNPRRSSTPLADAPADDPRVWAISCFFFARAARGLGLSHRMVAEGIAHARRNGARVLEASPMDEAKTSKSIGLYVGSTRVFEAAGFREVARARPGRPLVRLDL